MGVEMVQQNNRKQIIEWRRNKVQEYLVKGYNHHEIADTLKIPRTTISRDVGYLRQEAQIQLKTHIQDRLPEEYLNCMAGINRVLKLTLEIADKPTDDKTRLQALALANDCYSTKSI
jgi:DNA-binding transcriptional regulator LsrR (DeoR family)